MRILMILRAGPVARPSRPLGLNHVVEAYYILQDAGTEVVIASSPNGAPRIRAARNGSARATSSIQRFLNDRNARDAFSDTLKLEQIYSEDFDGAICINALEEPAESADAEAVLSLLKALLAAGKPVAIVPNEPEFVSLGSFKGLLIIGNGVRAPSLAAKAILGALNQHPG